ncbi:MAG: hypothetical protein ILP16_10010 [Spirochaetales bacterium]|nr:hypothetical protein [Spirochaetales bacterium]
MMYKNGIFGKRYGQSALGVWEYHEGGCLAMGSYRGKLFMQTKGTDGDNDVYAIWYLDVENGDTNGTWVMDVTEKPGIFFVFNRMLYFMSEDVYIQIDSDFQADYVEPYIPDILIVCNPDGTGGEVTDYNYNLLGAGFRVGFNGDGESTVYQLPKQKDNDGNDIPIDPLNELNTNEVVVLIGDTEYKESGPDAGFTVDRDAYTIEFDSPPPEGTDNVFITAYVTNPGYKEKIMGSKYAVSYGGNNNSHLFLAGNGKSTYYYSDVFDASYFPEMNYAVIGSTEDDITGFGLQYNVLIVFKPTEIFSIGYSFGKDTTGRETMILSSQPVNNEIGCTAPGSIEYIDNRLTWLNSTYGVCTLCSTAILDERNVRVVSRNVNGGEREAGLLTEPDVDKAFALDYEGKYILFVNNKCYMWDYTNAPFSESARYSVDEMAKATAWYRWDSIGFRDDSQIYPINAGIVIGKRLFYSSGPAICTFNNMLNDFGKFAIESCYQTPMFDFQAFESLKTIKQAFFEVRGDTATKIHITYLTDEDPGGEEDPEDIEIPAILWDAFTWSSFGWSIMQFAKTFARKCSIKKVMLFGVLLENNEFNRDMSLSGIKFKYTVVKEVK